MDELREGLSGQQAAERSPASPSFKIATIWASVNFDFLMRPPISFGRVHHCMVCKRGKLTDLNGRLARPLTTWDKVATDMMLRDPFGARFLAAVVSLPLLALLACASREPRGPRVAELLNFDTPNGRDLYRQLCASCHGFNGTGDGPLAEQLKVRLPDLTRLAANNGGTFPRTDVLATVTGQRAIPTHGPLSMPVWGRRLGPEDSPAAVAVRLDQARTVTAIVDYLASIQRADW
jgi:mono/diheme cytochrome c family protein